MIDRSRDERFSVGIDLGETKIEPILLTDSAGVFGAAWLGRHGSGCRADGAS